MARIQQSIETKVPVHAAFEQLCHFEDYAQFMQDVESVRRLDDTHWHWTTRMANRSVEWDAEITEQQPDRCLAWRNVSGPTNAGRIDVQPSGEAGTRIILTLDMEPEQVPGSMAGFDQNEMAQRVQADMARMKDFIEARGADVPGDATRADTERAQSRTAGSYAAGSEGWDGTEDYTAPVASHAHDFEAQEFEAGGARNDAGYGSAQIEEQQAAHQTPPEVAAAAGVGATTHSDYSLSRTADQSGEEYGMSVAEEVNFDQQAEAARRVGQGSPIKESIPSSGQGATDSTVGPKNGQQA